MILRIRLKKSYIQIEVKDSSKYLHSISKALLNVKCRDKKEQLLKNIYYLCAKNANYHNPQFFLKLIKSSYKNIVLHVNKDDSLKQYYTLLKSNEKDSLHVIRKRYLKLAKTYHPDRVVHKNSTLVDEYTRKFQHIQQAYEALKFQVAS
jgi:DnaJ-domain-containing protein 1